MAVTGVLLQFEGSLFTSSFFSHSAATPPSDLVANLFCAVLALYAFFGLRRYAPPREEGGTVYCYAARINTTVCSPTWREVRSRSPELPKRCNSDNIGVIPLPKVAQIAAAIDDFFVLAQHHAAELGVMLRW